MSTGFNDDPKIIKGRIQTIAAGTDLREHDMITMQATVENHPIWMECVLCEKDSYTRYRLLDEGLCELCRNRMINRLN